MKDNRHRETREPDKPVVRERKEEGGHMILYAPKAVAPIKSNPQS